jgi:enoyl-CoA hydratase
MEHFQFCRAVRDGHLLIITIDRPEVMNALHPPAHAELARAFDIYAADPELRVAIITGAGERAFCAGADLKALETLDPDAPGGPRGFTRLASPKPTIAAISGHCLAGGFELALWCDLRVATTTATFGCAERRWGVPLIDGGTQRLPRIVGTGVALDLILTGRTIDAQEARSLGLITALTEPQHHVARALTLADAISRHPRDTTNSDRRAVLEGEGLPLDRALRLEADLGRERIETALEGARRFAERNS